MLKVLSLLGQGTGMVEGLRSLFGKSNVRGLTLTSSVLQLLPFMVSVAPRKYGLGKQYQLNSRKECVTDMTKNRLDFLLVVYDFIFEMSHPPPKQCPIDKETGLSSHFEVYQPFRSLSKHQRSLLQLICASSSSGTPTFTRSHDCHRVYNGERKVSNLSL